MSLRIYGNRLLKTVPGQQTRPTSARVREAIFNIWQGSISGCRWLDLCAGAGSMSAEALCRGASEVVAIEQSGRAWGIIQENLAKVANDEQSFQVLRGDVVKQLKNLAGQQFDRIYFDPPYASDLYQPVISLAASLLAPDGEMAVEHDRDMPPVCFGDRDLSPETDEAQTDRPILEICRQKVYGNTAVTFYRLVTD
ncbi:MULTISPECIES: 16S rRNA (guanine(966)-N(2))-methyltransferase RsmD [Planktothricoides]|uniref:16S rRNA (Guanine(966)-N(2))-methyltransferase RsmD n=2 Tax=Planktothricoides raciborskii TaxID=132608 RepID=A0AAU8JAT4_9CYAN|nr:MULTISPECIES: 16S rRNA (guanine(966)-N(2))-methyltransferase RsmD [Planktothricoides]KOR37941.1 methyltransferase [Planktothricoides sp. SR001]MBD2542782.1 16S rRNA (guanine(966)-N(2))-methyltransferase RsmD [Planktothricoides raciborskii FACHB-1370]MBD2581471.1 16S rRNA (guanine(966)-N(2))-methyltransferase RsmD [Planktothricoides raciborskii FACHB-1261]